MGLDLLFIKTVGASSKYGLIVVAVIIESLSVNMSLVSVAKSLLEKPMMD